MGSRPRPRITVLAGTNGAGKSSVAGEALMRDGMDFFNPDQAARLFLAANPSLSQLDANSLAWQEGKRLLQDAIAQQINYALETTLGGHTITALLQLAASRGIDVHIWYVGLASPELHIARVKARVAKGGHNIPDDKIRERYSRSVLNLIELMPSLAELVVFDNTKEADPQTGATPEPLLILHLRRRKILNAVALEATPDWAKPIVVAALDIATSK